MVSRDRSKRRRRLSAPSVPGSMAACLMLVAASTAAAGAPADGPVAPAQNRPPAGNPRVPGEIKAGRGLPDLNQAAESVDSTDGSGPTIPAVFTGDIPATVLDSYR